MPVNIPRGFTGEVHPEVFTVPPPQPEAKKPGQLTPEQLKHFFEKVQYILFPCGFIFFYWFDMRALD